MAAKYSKEYSKNRKLNPNKKKLDGLERGPDGNFIMKNDTGDPFGGYTGNNAGVQDSGISSNPNTGQGGWSPTAGQYAQYGAIAINGANDLNKIDKDKSMGQYAKSDAYGDSLGNTATQGIGTINPIIGMGTAVRKPLTERVGAGDGSVGNTAANWMAGPHEALADDISAYKSAENGKQKFGSIAAAVGDLTMGTKIAQTFSYGTGNDKKTSGAWGTFNDLTGISSRNNKAKNIYDEANPIATPDFQYKEKSLEDSVFQKERGTTQFEMGGNLTQYEGNTHENGGIALGQMNEVETGETRGPKNSPTTKDYIYSDTLKVGKKTFADLSKAIERKYSKRENDKMSKEQKELELSNLMNAQETQRQDMMAKTYKKAYGGDLNLSGGFDPNTLKHTLKQGQKPYSNKELLGMGYQTGNSSNEYITPNGDYVFYKPEFEAANNMTMASTTKPVVKPKFPRVGTPEWDANQSNVEALRNANYGMHRAGGKLKYDGTGPYSFLQDVENDNKRNNSLTRAIDEGEVNLAAQDFGNSVRSGQNLQMTGQTLRDSYGYNTPNAPAGQYSPKYNPYQKSLKPFDLDGKDKFANINAQDSSYEQSPSDVVTNPKGNTAGNFDPNSLYAAGNFMGATYDIYRGLKGGDPVNYDRINTQTVDPALVSYQTSRDLNRRDIKEGFRNVQKDVKNSGAGSASYLSMLSQSAGQRDKTISDSTAKSFENESNVNAGLRNQAKYFNASSKTNADVFNAQTQRAELDARQEEKDISKNTLSTGLYNAGMATSQMGSDANFTKQDKLAMDAIGQKYPNWKYDSKTNKWKFKNQTKTTAELIG